jgi:hypothetical protein
MRRDNARRFAAEANHPKRVAGEAQTSGDVHREAALAKARATAAARSDAAHARDVGPHVYERPDAPVDAARTSGKVHR